MDKYEFNRHASRLDPSIKSIVVKNSLEFSDEYINTLIDEIKWFMIERVKEHGFDDLIVQKILELFEIGIIQGDDELKQAIAVSFVEGIEIMDPIGEAIAESFEPGLASERGRQNSWSSDTKKTSWLRRLLPFLSMSIAVVFVFTACDSF